MKTSPPSTSEVPTRNRRLGIAVGTIAVIAGGFGALFALTPSVHRPGFVEGRALLEQDGKLFTDHQVSLQFTPPPEWAMQVRSTESPEVHKSERMVVKFKRMTKGPTVAWLRVHVADATTEASPAELVKDRKPKEIGWTVIKPVEDGLTVAGQPAARITFGGKLNPDGRGPRDCAAEIVAIRYGKRAYFFAGTYAVADKDTQKLLRETLDTAIFDPAKFVKE